MCKVHSKNSDARLIAIAVVLACNLLFHEEQKLVAPSDVGIWDLFLSAIVLLTTADGIWSAEFEVFLLLRRGYPNLLANFHLLGHESRVRIANLFLGDLNALLFVRRNDRRKRISGLHSVFETFL